MTSFVNSPIPARTPNQLPIRTAACLIIGDEILNGKTVDTNSAHFAKYCFELGIELKRIEVIADDEDEIIEASRRMVKNYDFVITSGGIGPTHDDITYQSLAKAFNQELAYNEETRSRMRQHILGRTENQNPTAEQTKARDRMALFPDKAEVLFVDPALWVPIVRLEGKLCILPGVPVLLRKLLEGLKPYLVLPDATEKQFRHLIRTEMPESFIAPFLTGLAERVKAQGIKVGSYPSFNKGVTVSLLGQNVELVKQIGEEVR
ncbi:Molybdopterin binding protein [Clavulina sp. PMI_390]|nr:Molybdopterin binding protein [Clavulina sp. PMI_390]